eukprot:6259880-Amphidinium_carterae.1
MHAQLLGLSATREHKHLWGKNSPQKRTNIRAQTLGVREEHEGDMPPAHAMSLIWYPCWTSLNLIFMNAELHWATVLDCTELDLDSSADCTELDLSEVMDCTELTWQ